MAGPHDAAINQVSTLLPAETMMMAGTVVVAIAGIAPGVVATKAKADAGLNNDWALHSTVPVATLCVAIATLRSLSHPLTDGAAVAVIADDLVNGHDGSAAGGVAYDPGLALAFSFGIGGSCKTKNCGCSED